MLNTCFRVVATYLSQEEQRAKASALALAVRITVPALSQTTNRQLRRKRVLTPQHTLFDDVFILEICSHL